MKALAPTLIALLLLTGCVTPQQLSQGSVPCRADEMAISDQNTPPFGPQTWTVLCHDKRYYCAARYGQYSAPAVNCILAEVGAAGETQQGEGNPSE